MPLPTSLDLGDAARADLADLIDRQLSPPGLAAMDALAPAPGETILDIGCGAGQTLRQLTERVGPTGRVIGVDIAPRVLAVARARTADLPNVDLIEADAARLALPGGSVDGVYSRFGVMAIDDPVAAFARFRRMMRPGGRLAFVCWRALSENEIDALPLRAAGIEAGVDATPFRFERRDYLGEVLEAAGYRDVWIEALDIAVSCGGLDETVAVLTNVGALGKILRENPSLRAEAEPKVRAALPDEAEISLMAAVWVVTARAE